MSDYDIAIIGAGGAGLTAAIYAARARRKTIVFEGKVLGGQIATTDIVENYPGFPDGINGFDLAQRMFQQAEKFGAEFAYEPVDRLTHLPDGGFQIATSERTITARAAIVTAGADYNKLGVPGEAEFTGRGVSYCGTCDAAFFVGKEVIVVGGGDSALDEGLFITRYASTVTVVHRRETLRASAILQERAFAEPKMRFRWNTVVEAIEGTDSVERVRLRNLVTGAVETLPIDGVFIFIGQTPNNHLLRGLVQLDAGGHALVDLDMATGVPGLFVAGDLRTRAARQLVSAAGDGATAAISAEHYLTTLDASPERHG
ncbi:thioredoxin-disulfide reductase [Tepidiforma sp.]|uniref:thioredoxin-disulfide reductase n=1 Tax=Tepidiforma sp. TaxID=2682230 RepID=UPI002ADDDF6C|nr:thioredoxin-disulfide reductase [Tepidiforma sp.]